MIKNWRQFSTNASIFEMLRNKSLSGRVNRLFLRTSCSVLRMNKILCADITTIGE